MTEFTKIVRDGLEKACKEFTLSAGRLGFARTKKMFWTRQNMHTIDFVHFHRSGSSYGSPISASVEIRVHFGIRVLNDVFPAAALNGPNSDAESVRTGRYHLRFNANSGSTYERCVQDLERFMIEVGEPWFEKFAGTNGLLERADSPLSAEEKVHLKDALVGNARPENMAASRKILGLQNVVRMNASPGRREGRSQPGYQPFFTLE